MGGEEGLLPEARRRNTFRSAVCHEEKHVPSGAPRFDRVRRVSPVLSKLPTRVFVGQLWSAFVAAV